MFDDLWVNGTQWHFEYHTPHNLNYENGALLSDTSIVTKNNKQRRNLKINETTVKWLFAVDDI